MAIHFDHNAKTPGRGRTGPGLTATRTLARGGRPLPVAPGQGFDRVGHGKAFPAGVDAIGFTTGSPAVRRPAPPASHPGQAGRKPARTRAIPHLQNAFVAYETGHRPRVSLHETSADAHVSRHDTTGKAA